MEFPLTNKSVTLKESIKNMLMCVGNILPSEDRLRSIQHTIANRKTPIRIVIELMKYLTIIINFGFPFLDWCSLLIPKTPNSTKDVPSTNKRAFR